MTTLAGHLKIRTEQQHDRWQTTKKVVILDSFQPLTAKKKKEKDVYGATGKLWPISLHFVPAHPTYDWRFLADTNLTCRVTFTRIIKIRLEEANATKKVKKLFLDGQDF